MCAMKLFVGNKNYSSWSLRPWLVLRWAGLPFETVVLPLGGPGYGQGRIPEVRAVSPTGKVPALVIGSTVIWDSLAIAEWAAEQEPSLWPKDPLRRAVARSATAEMHSGFAAIRRDLSMNIRRRVAGPDWPADTCADLDRLFALLGDNLDQSGGPWLFADRSIADAFFVPMATRLRTYGVPAPDPVATWCARVLSDSDFLSWETDALAEPWRHPAADSLYA